MNSVIEKEKKLNLALTQLKKLNLKKFLNKTVATSAIPIGIPGWPEFAASTASKDRNLTALAKSLCFIFKNIPI